MDAYFGIVMLVGKYLFLGLIYWFIYWAFRGLFAEMRADRHAPAPAVASVSARTGAVAPAAARPVAAPRPSAPAPAMASAPAAVAAVPDPAPPPALAPPPAAVAAPALAALVVKDPGQSNLRAGQALDLTAAVTIGRAADNGITLQDRFCSQHHAMVFLQQGRRMLRDRNSTNGTFHNGRPVTEDVVLQNGDQITIGTVTFTYRSAH